MFTWNDLIKASPAKRRKLWAQLRIDLPEEAEWWEEESCCWDDEGAPCVYRLDGWCKYIELPCGFNPFLTPRTGTLGMACMGMRPPQQLQIEFEVVVK